MLKRLLLSAIVLSAISGSSYAVDVKLPGADPSISRDAYVQAVYTTDKIESTGWLFISVPNDCYCYY